MHNFLPWGLYLVATAFIPDAHLAFGAAQQLARSVKQVTRAEQNIYDEAPIYESTVANDLKVFVIGAFPSVEDAEELRTSIIAITRILGTFFDLSFLDGITVADDYFSALQSIERGFPGMKAPIPTNDQFGTGFAMALPVLRDGRHCTHVVLDSRLVRTLVDPSNASYQGALHTLSHELAHVYDHGLQNIAFPGFYGSQLTDLRESVLTRLALPAWDEYAASRLSARWGREDYCADFEEALCRMLESTLMRGEKCKMEFTQHQDVSKTLYEITDVYGDFFIRYSYLIGHLDGLDRELSIEAPKLQQMLDNTSWLRQLLEEYMSILRSLFKEHGQWHGLAILEPLKQNLERILSMGGVRMTKSSNGGYSAHFFKVMTL
jgi:hypothetical protein